MYSQVDSLCASGDSVNSHLEVDVLGFEMCATPFGIRKPIIYLHIYLFTYYCVRVEVR